jgi:hypothetical protein
MGGFKYLVKVMRMQNCVKEITKCKWVVMTDRKNAKKKQKKQKKK